jgi:glutaredoxin
MRNTLFIVATLCATVGVVYYFLGAFIAPPGAFDDEGRPVVWVFVDAHCPPCAAVESLLTERAVPYQRIEFGPSTAREYGVESYPTTVAGRRRVFGSEKGDIVSLLAETYGTRFLTPLEQWAMAGHFDPDGRKRVVLYSTQWCSYCKRPRQYLNDRFIPFTEVDIEASGKAAYEALGGGGVPTMYVGYHRLAGYSDGEIQAAVGERP